jgi:hypothetical protein
MSNEKILRMVGASAVPGHRSATNLATVVFGAKVVVVRR